MDFSSSQIVQSCMDVSPNIKDYFDEERYLAEVDQPESLTPHLVEIMAVNLLLDELAQIGLETNQTAEEIAEYPTELNTVLDMRTAFDAEKFYQLLKAMTEEQFSEFKAVIEECANSGDFLFEITDYCYAHFSTDERWENIHASAEHWWWSTDNFAKHINALIEKVERNSDPNKAVVDDGNVSDIASFLLKFTQRKDQVKHFADYIVNSDSWHLNVPLLVEMVENYDKVKLSPDLLPKFADYDAHKSDYEKEPDFVTHHHYTTNHHLEYWKSIDDRHLQREDLVMIIASLFLDKLSKEDIVKQVTPLVNMHIKTKNDKVVAESDIKFLKYLINLDFNQIASGEIANATITE